MKSIPLTVVVRTRWPVRRHQRRAAWRMHAIWLDVSPLAASPRRRALPGLKPSSCSYNHAQVLGGRPRRTGGTLRLPTTVTLMGGFLARVAAGLFAGLFTGFLAGLLAGFLVRFPAGLLAGLLAAFLAGLPAGFFRGFFRAFAAMARYDSGPDVSSQLKRIGRTVDTAPRRMYSGQALLTESEAQMTRRVFIAAAAVAALAAGCTPSHSYFRPEGVTVERIGSDLGRSYDVPPGKSGKAARLVVSTDGARVVRNRNGESVLVVRMRFSLDNYLDEAVRLAPRATTLVDNNDIIFPAKYVTSTGVGDDGTVGANQKGTVDIYFELGPPTMIHRVVSIKISWLYSIGDTTYPGQTKFVRFEPIRLGYYYDPYPAGWALGWGIGGVIFRSHRHRTGSWGP